MSTTKRIVMALLFIAFFIYLRNGNPSDVVTFALGALLIIGFLIPW